MPWACPSGDGCRKPHPGIARLRPYRASILTPLAHPWAGALRLQQSPLVALRLAVQGRSRPLQPFDVSTEPEASHKAISFLRLGRDSRLKPLVKPWLQVYSRFLELPNSTRLA